MKNKSFEIVISKKHEDFLEKKIRAIRLFEEMQDMIYQDILKTLSINKNSREDDVLFDYVYNNTPYVKDWIRFK